MRKLIKTGILGGRAASKAPRGAKLASPIAAIVLAIVLGGPLAAAADVAPEPPPTTKTAAKDAEGFEPVDGNMLSAGETIPANRLVAAAYGFILAALIVYVGSVVTRMRRVEDEIDSLRKRLDEKK